MDRSAFARRLDATNLKLDARESDIEALCREARDNGYAAVCVYPLNVGLCTRLLRGSDTAVCTVANFPHGRCAVRAVLAEIEEAASGGARELDFVMPPAGLRQGGTGAEAAEAVSVLCRAVRQTGMLSKVIVETCHLDEAGKLDALRICEDAGADFIKTSTGFAAAGATVEDVRLFATRRRGPIRIKASGGIRTAVQALDLLTAGADRLGVSAAAALLRELR